MQHRATETERSYVIRFEAYWSHIELIAGDLLDTVRGLPVSMRRIRSPRSRAFSRSAGRFPI